MGGAALIGIIFVQTALMVVAEPDRYAALGVSGIVLTLWIVSLSPPLLALALLLALIAGLGYRIEQLR